MTTSKRNLYLNSDYLVSMWFDEVDQTTVLSTVKGLFYVTETPEKIIELINETMWPVAHES